MQDDKAVLSRLVAANFTLPQGANDRQVHVKLAEQLTVVGFNNTTTVGQIKIAANCPCAALRFNDVVLADVKPVISYGIVDGVTLVADPVPGFWNLFELDPEA